MSLQSTRSNLHVIKCVVWANWAKWWSESMDLLKLHRHYTEFFESKFRVWISNCGSSGPKWWHMMVSMNRTSWNWDEWMNEIIIFNKIGFNDDYNNDIPIALRTSIIIIRAFLFIGIFFFFISAVPLTKSESDLYIDCAQFLLFP